MYNESDDIHDVIIAYDKDLPVVSVSFKRYGDENTEVKSIHKKNIVGVEYLLN